MTIKQEYRQFLNENFKGQGLKQPLFYNWEFGLRFNLQTGETSNSDRIITDGEGNIIPNVGDTDSEEYFQELAKRASVIFKTAFDNSDQVFLVLKDYKYRRRKIRFSNFTFKQIENPQKSDFSYFKEFGLYDPKDKFDIRNVAIVKLPVDRINYKNILTAIGNSDFSSRQPRLDQYGVFTNKEIYFVNIDKKLIFHMYDDRGLDLVSVDKEILRPIYEKHNDWILDYDRIEIDKKFKRTIA